MTRANANTLRHFLRGRRGAAAVEFGLLAPVLVVMLLGVAEAGRFIYLHLKISNVVSNVADIVARSEVASENEMTSLFSALPVMLSPFESSGRFGVIVSGVVRLEADEPPVVAWQAAGGPVAVPSDVGAEGAEANTPDDLTFVGGDALIAAEIVYNYDGWLFGVVPSQTVRDRAFARPRRSMLTTLE